jgi:hypothetical protein
MKNKIDYETLAMELLDFCGGAEPTKKQTDYFFEKKKLFVTKQEGDLVYQKALEFLQDADYEEQAHRAWYNKNL